MRTESAEITQDFDSSLIKELDIITGAGNIVVSPCTHGHASVTAHKKHSCNIVMVLKDGKLSIFAVKKGLFDFGNGAPDMDVEIKAPKNVNIKIETSSGDTHISGMEGDINIASGSGSVTADGKIRKLMIKSASGNIKTKGLEGDAQISNGDGEVILSYDMTKNGKVRINSVKGHSDIYREPSYVPVISFAAANARWRERIPAGTAR